MARTNSTITISQKTVDWKKTDSTPISLGSYSVYLEHHISFTKLQSLFGGSFDIINKAKGFCIMFDEVDLVNCYITYNGTTYEILKYSVFNNMKGDFHHIEFIYG
ncbi:MAG TPA: hypothetical protein PLQ68_04565 [Clostridia bacterium]|nr:hypothetical protein [Clostridia bacterium]